MNRYCSRAIFATIMLGFVLCNTTIAENRIWTDRRGRSISAEFVRVSGEEALFRQASGSVVRVRLDQLSDADQEYLKNLLNSRGFRLWTDNRGEQILARYLRANDGMIYLSYEGGSTSAPFESFSTADKLYMRRTAELAKESDQLPPPTPDELLQPERLWTDKDDEQVIAQLDRVLLDGKVFLACNGTTRVIDIEELSQEDHDYLREELSPELVQLVPDPPRPPATSVASTDTSPRQPDPVRSTTPPVTTPPSSSPTP